MARGLVAQGAELLVMPCNSAHAFADAVREAAAPVPFLDLIETTVAATRERLPGVAAVGLLATDGALAARLYQDAYEAAGVRALAPLGDDQRSVMDAIYAVKRGPRTTRCARACGSWPSGWPRPAPRRSSPPAPRCRCCCAEGDVRRRRRALPVRQLDRRAGARTVAEATPRVD
jgi:hypothetical protein